MMSQLVNNFAARDDVEVHLILTGKKREIVHEIPNVVFVHKPDFKFNNSRRTIDTIRTIRFLRSRVTELNPDAVLSFGEIWNNLVLIALYGCDFPVYISDRSQPDKDLGRIHNFLRHKLYPNAAGYIAQTKEAKKVCLINKWNDNVQVIGNPIRQIASNGHMGKENIVLTVGRLIKTKNVDQLVRIFAEIDNPGWKLVIVGGDAKQMKLSNDLENLIRDIGVENSVFLEGMQKDIDRYYNKSKIFAFCSSSEGFPNVIGEALSAGLPVVAYDCIAGPSDMIKDGKNGSLVPLFNQEDFKSRLEELMNNQQRRKRFQQHAKESIRKYSETKISDKFYSFITDKS